MASSSGPAVCTREMETRTLGENIAPYRYYFNECGRKGQAFGAAHVKTSFIRTPFIRTRGARPGAYARAGGNRLAVCVSRLFGGSRQLCFLNHGLRDLRRRLLVTGKLKGEAPSALGERTQLGAEIEHLGYGSLSFHHLKTILAG